MARIPEQSGSTLAARVTGVDARASELETHTDGWANVKSYGAKGDGVTNDTDAFNAAIASVHSGAGALGGTVIVPWSAQPYRVSEAVVGGPVRILGASKQGVKIKPYADSGSVFVASSTFAHFEGLHIEGPGKTSDTTGIDIRSALVTVDECHFAFLGQGVWVRAGYGADEPRIYRSRFSSCDYAFRSSGSSINGSIEQSTVAGCNSAVYLIDVSGSPTEGFSIANNLIYSCGNSVDRAAIHAVGTDFTYVRSNMVDLNTWVAMWLENCHFCRIEGTYFAANFSANSSAARLVGDCSGSALINCQFVSEKNWGLEIVGASGNRSDGVNLIGNWFRLNPSGDLLVNGGKRIVASDCQFTSGTSTDVAILADEGADASLYLNYPIIAGSTYEGEGATLTVNGAL